MTAIFLITGANKGLGLETARLVVDLGHVVYVGARDSARGKQAAADIGARFLQLDVTEDASVNEALRTIASAEGRLDVPSTTPGSQTKDTGTVRRPVEPSTPMLSGHSGSVAVAPALGEPRSS